jgi:NADPH-dependent 2,4-dienoyl-CoA reductase/sulfur reductase-like enzyme/rhodanese-related sulfurtransferase
MKKVIIIGGMAAGCKTATHLKRMEPEFEVTIIEKQSMISYEACGLPYFASGDIQSIGQLSLNPWGTLRDSGFFKNAKGVNTYTETEVTKIDNEKNILHCKNLKSNDTFTLEYDYLVFTSGTVPVEPYFVIPESEKITYFRNSDDAEKFNKLAQTGQIGRAAIIGGDYLGCELAEATTALWGIETHLIESSDCLISNSFDKEMSAKLYKKLKENDINIYFNANIKNIEINENDEFLITIGNDTIIQVDYIFVNTGTKPNTELAKSIGCKTGDLCGIKVDNAMMTNLPNVWAGGDCAEINNIITGTPFYQTSGAVSARQGRIIAESITGKNPKFDGTVGIQAVKIFGLSAISVGLNESMAKSVDLDYKCVWGTLLGKPKYMPESNLVFAKLIYETNTMRLLGLQLISESDVAQYANAFSVLVSENKTVNHLFNFEHAFTPNISYTLNPLYFLAAMAVAQEKMGVGCTNPQKFAEFNGQIFDIREAGEIEKFPINRPNVSASFTEYRDAIEQLDKSKPVLTVCMSGGRSYEAALYLKQNGFDDVAYLGGGINLA